VSADSPAAPATAVTSINPAEFGRTARAILATMLLLIVALTGILVQTTWRNPTAAIEAPASEPGSVARR
jgi:hypothetical protein